MKLPTILLLVLGGRSRSWRDQIDGFRQLADSDSREHLSKVARGKNVRLRRFGGVSPQEGWGMAKIDALTFQRPIRPIGPVNFRFG